VPFQPRIDCARSIQGQNQQILYGEYAHVQLCIPWTIDRSHSDGSLHGECGGLVPVVGRKGQWRLSFDIAHFSIISHTFLASAFPFNPS
jgi:hypothetical protein